MELTPLYELRDRLRAGIIAGAALAAEDFRLSRAPENFAPLEKASPVFAKVGQLGRSALAPDCQDRAGALLDAITLCDAVLCTQGAVAVPGELEDLPPPGRRGGADQRPLLGGGPPGGGPYHQGQRPFFHRHRHP